jgi:hypothetical protein
MQYAFSHRCQIEAPIETVAEGTQIAIRILVKAQGMERAVEAGLQVAEHRVDPSELRQLLGMSPFDDDRLMNAADLSHSKESGQAVGNHFTGFGQATWVQFAMAAKENVRTVASLT